MSKLPEHILVTGAKGFIGKHLVKELEKSDHYQVYEYDINSSKESLEEFCRDCDFVFHLAGVNRTKDKTAYMKGNLNMTAALLEELKKHGNLCPILYSSSIHAMLDNPYGISKKASEDLLYTYGLEAGVKVYIYRFSNVFGAGCRPNYNSVIATFCYNIANNLPIQIKDSSIVMNLIYIDDLIKEIITPLKESSHKNLEGFYYVQKIHTITLGAIADLLYMFKVVQEKNIKYDWLDSFNKYLYTTYISYRPME